MVVVSTSTSADDGKVVEVVAPTVAPTESPWQDPGGTGNSNINPPGQCVDEPDWTDSEGDGCGWYAATPLGQPDRCAEYGLCCRGNTAMVAADACCVCRGKMMAATAVSVLGKYSNSSLTVVGGAGGALPSSADDAEETAGEEGQQNGDGSESGEAASSPATASPTGTPTPLPVKSRTEAKSGASTLAATSVVACSSVLAALCASLLILMTN